MTSPDQPEPAIVEWGTERSWSDRLVPRSYPRGLGPVLAGLGGLALFGSLVSDWQTTRYILDGEGFIPEEARELRAGVMELQAYGAGWVVGALALLTVALLVARTGRSTPSGFRTCGLAGAGALLLLLVAVTVTLRSEGPFPEELFGLDQEVEYRLGRGLAAAYAAVLCLAAVLWISRPAPDLAGRYPDGQLPRQADPYEGEVGRSGYAGPEDLSVTAADPSVLPGEPDRR